MHDLSNAPSGVSGSLSVRACEWNVTQCLLLGLYYIHELRLKKISMKQKSEKYRWFKQLLACKDINKSGLLTFVFHLAGVHVCWYTFYKAHGFHGDRNHVSSCSTHFETLIIKAGFTHVPGKIREPCFSIQAAVAGGWLWRHIKMMGKPKPNSDGPVGKMYLRDAFRFPYV